MKTITDDASPRIRSDHDSPRTFAHIVLWVTGVIFLGFGLAYLGFPVPMAGQAGVELPVASAVTDARSIHGGLQLGLGVFLFFCAFQRSAVTVGLVAVIATLGGAVMGRAIGIVVDGSTDMGTVMTLAFEATGPLVALLALALERRGERLDQSVTT